MAKQSKEQKETVARVMHEYKHGELKSGTGADVKSPQQAKAIALHEAGATNQEDAKTNRENLRETKAKERKGETAEAEKEGKGAQKRTMAKYTDGRSSGGSDKTKDELYHEAQKRDIQGRSKMSKGELEKALS
ncbi:DUF6496 domain-containing protein [Consotaella salsifontis]|uniref:Rho termination factor, N-terminal domain n=1 Tax=Consotaella salsifontis TaxID=1365950 RepID=A0A1T4RBZ0_9HYPH|nr:DUF6496 domain-containing protein [Consotaella salsifontis]SKA13572.1 hypothetical protein SAMN05428963_106200 [Consotaella salsifontis]